MLLLAFFGFALSCSSDDGVTGDNTNPDDSGSDDGGSGDGGSDDGSGDSGSSTDLFSVSFSSELDGLTGAGNDAFEEGTVISIYNGEEIKEYSFSGEGFSSDEPFKVDRATNYQYATIYPTPADPSAVLSSGSYTFTAAADQSAGLVSSDLLVGATSSTNSVSPTLSFGHAMASIVITVTHDSFSTTDSGVLTVNAAAEATCNLSDLTVAASGSASAITAYYNGSNQYIAIIAPQSIASGADFVTYVDAAGGITSQTYSLTSTVEFEAGGQYTYKYDASSNTLTFVSATIGAWLTGEGGTINGIATLTSPIVATAPGSLRAQVEWSVLSPDSRITTVDIYEDDALVASDVDFNDGSYIVEGLSAGTHSLGVQLKGDGLQSLVTSADVEVYDLAAFSYTEEIDVCLPYHSFVTGENDLTIYWSAEDSAYSDGEVTISFDGGETTIAVDKDADQTTYSEGTLGGEYEVTVGVMIDELPEGAIDPYPYTVEYTIPSTSVGDVFAKDGTVYNNPFDWVDDNHFPGDYATYTTSYIGSISIAWDGTKSYDNTATNANGYHANNSTDVYSGVDGCVTFDLQANYYLGQFAWWWRRGTLVYASNSDAPSEFTIYGAADLGDGTTLDNTMEDYNKTVDGLATGTADFDNMPKWIKLLESDALTREGSTTTYANLILSTVLGDMQDARAVRNGFHYLMDDTTTAVRYIRIQFNSTWSGSTTPSPQISELDFWGTLAE